MKYYDNKTIWITGASQGIGYEITKILSQQNCKLILSSRKKEDLEKVANELDLLDYAIIPLDLGKHNELDEILRKHDELLKDVDILINNAGISQRSLILDTNIDVYKKLIDINYIGTIMISDCMLNHFNRKGSGHFVTVSSVAGLFATPYRSGYSASKMALKGYFEALRAENDKKDIHISMVYPGFIHTNISKNALIGDGSTNDTMDDAQANGMAASTAAQIIIDGIAKKKASFTVGKFKETKLAPLVHRLFPNLFRRIIKKSAVR